MAVDYKKVEKDRREWLKNTKHYFDANKYEIVFENGERLTPEKWEAINTKPII